MRGKAYTVQSWAARIPVKACLCAQTAPLWAGAVFPSWHGVTQKICRASRRRLSCKQSMLGERTAARCGSWSGWTGALWERSYSCLPLLMAASANGPQARHGPSVCPILPCPDGSFALLVLCDICGSFSVYGRRSVGEEVPVYGSADTCISECITSPGTAQFSSLSAIASWKGNMRRVRCSCCG